MKSFLLALTFLISAAHAETFKCGFNEPFILITVNTDTGSVVWDSIAESVDDGPQNAVVRSMHVSQSAVLTEFKVGKINYVLEIDLKKRSNDGMSEFVYPTKGSLVQYYTNGRDLVTGCESEKRKKICPKGAACG